MAKQKKREAKGKTPTSEAAQSPTNRPTKRVLLEWAKSLAIAFAIWFVLQAMVVKSFRITSGSMEHTLLPGDWLFINRVVYGGQVPLLGLGVPGLRAPRHDDLVVFRSPVSDAFAAELGIEAHVDVVKRLIGIPGDTLEMRSDSLFRNGQYVVEPYAQHLDPRVAMPAFVLGDVLRWQRPHLIGTDSAYVPGLRTWGPLVLPPSSYFVMGDNRDESVDSRYWGFLPRENLMGAVMITYFSYDPSSWHPLPFLTAIRWGRILRKPG